MDCPVCHRKRMFTFIELPASPVHCNLLWPSREAAVGAPRGDIRLGFCHGCGMIYNLSFDPPLMTYTQAYENSLHFSPRFQAYARELAAQLIAKYQLYGKDIIEIGCGRGEFLSLLCEGGRNRALGFDPGWDGSAAGNGSAGDIAVIADVYSETYAEYPAGFICCRQVLEHIHSPRTFLSQLRRAIGDRQDTVVFFEVPNVCYTLRDLSVWDLIYEHCSYFSAPSLTKLFQESEFRVLHQYAAFDGQFLCLEASPGAPASNGSRTSTVAVAELMNLVYMFRNDYRHKMEAWEEYVGRRFEEGHCLVVWGAGSKGVMFLNTVKASGQIKYVVDINPRKQGMYVAGTGQRIVSPDFLCEYRPEVILVMNPIYKAEIRELVSRLGVAAEIVTV